MEPVASIASIDSLDDLVDDITTAERSRARRALVAVQIAAAGPFRRDGAITMCSWLTHHARMSRPDAARLLTEGRFLHRYPAIAHAAITGKLTHAQIGPLREMVITPLAPIFETLHPGLVDALTGLDLTDSRTVVNAWRQHAEALAEMPEPKITERSFNLSEMPDGTGMVRIVLQPSSLTQLRHALDTARRLTHQPTGRHKHHATSTLTTGNRTCRWRNRAVTPQRLVRATRGIARAVDAGTDRSACGPPRRDPDRGVWAPVRVPRDSG